MRTAHSHLSIHDTHFEAMLECYKEAFEACEIDTMDSEVLISKLDYLRKEVLNE